MPLPDLIDLIRNAALARERVRDDTRALDATHLHLLLDAVAVVAEPPNDALLVLLGSERLAGRLAGLAVLGRVGHAGAARAYLTVVTVVAGAGGRRG